MKKYSLIYIFFFFCSVGFAQNNATYKEYVKEYITYPFSDPDPIPATDKLYPYFRFDGFSSKGILKQWKVIDLENDYIKVQIMPEIGGKVWSAYDKVHQKDFLYDNEVVKFRDIAMRGPWVSGGIEANYGIIGHTPNSATPTDYFVRNNKNGSVSCFVSALDLLTRTRWVLEIKLEKDKAYFITKSYWFNSTNEERPYYTWMNAGIPAGNDLKFLYPGNKYIGHDGISHSWPIDNQGRDLSIYSENSFGDSKSYHVMGTYSNYFGAIWEDDDFGMIRYSNRDDKLGKKIFLWAQSDSGKIWEDLLTDSSGQYVEIQSGRLFNQNVFSSSLTPFKQIGFKPYSDESWIEYWYPFGGIKGFTGANVMGALNVKANEKNLEVRISPVQYVQDSIKVFNEEGKVIASSKISVTPLKPEHLTLDLPEAELPSMLTIDGLQISLESKEFKTLSRPEAINSELDLNSAYGLFLEGRDFYRFRNYRKAEEKIKSSLRKNSAFAPALVEMAKHKLRKMEYDSAFYYSRKALSIDTYDGDANYYYGISALKINQFYDAKDGFEVAGLTSAFRNAAYTSLSRMYLAEKDLLNAKKYALKALQANPNNLEVLKLLYVIARLEDNTTSKDEILTKIRSLNPLDHFIRFEKYYQDQSKEHKQEFLGLIKNEMPIETFLELAIWYANLNLVSESIRVLEIAPNNAESFYWLAWLNRGKEISTKYLSQADSGSLDFVFPFREESAQVFSWAISMNTKSWRPVYLLALIHDFRGNREEAAALLNKFDQVDHAPFYIVKARVNDGEANEIKKDLINNAVILQPTEWRYKRIYAQVLFQDGEATKAIKLLEDTYKKDKGNYVVGLDLVKMMIKENQYNRAEKILSNINLLPFEGASDSRKMYRQTKLMLAYMAMERKRYSEAIAKIEESEEWPTHLGVGKPYADLIDSRLENSLRVLIYGRMGLDEEQAKYSAELEGKLIAEEDLLNEIKSITIDQDERLF